jgi:hypothetical protein
MVPAPSDPNEGLDNVKDVEGMLSPSLYDLCCFLIFVLVLWDEPPDDFGNDNADTDIPDPLPEVIVGPRLHDNGILFSAGEDPVSAMSESLARALRNSSSSTSEAGEAELRDEGFDFEENDPYYCEGTTYFPFTMTPRFAYA